MTLHDVERRALGRQFEVGALVVDGEGLHGEVHLDAGLLLELREVVLQIFEVGRLEARRVDRRAGIGLAALGVDGGGGEGAERASENRATTKMCSWRFLPGSGPPPFWLGVSLCLTYGRATPPSLSTAMIAPSPRRRTDEPRADRRRRPDRGRDRCGHRGGHLPARTSSCPARSSSCRRFGASRTVVREAFKLLSAKGLIASRKRAGHARQPREAWHMLDADVLAWRLSNGEAEPKFVFDLLQARAVIEPAAAAMAARSHTPRHCRDRGAFADMERAAHDASLFAEPDIRFHKAILAGDGNDLMTAFGALIEAALGHVRADRVAPCLVRRRPRCLCIVAILDAIRRRDAEGAHAAMLALLDRTSRNVERNVAAGPVPRKAPSSRELISARVQSTGVAVQILARYGRTIAE